MTTRTSYERELACRVSEIADVFIYSYINTPLTLLLQNNVILRHRFKCHRLDLSRRDETILFENFLPDAI